MSLYMFIASDYLLPEVENTKIRRYKFKEGVKLDLDENGKWFFYTNEYDKNSSDLLIPCGSHDNADMINVDSEEDLGEIAITATKKSDETEFYTSKEHIRMLSWRYSDKRAEQLIGYLKENISNEGEIELWSIWLGESKEPSKIHRSIDDLTIEDFNKVFFKEILDDPKCLIVSCSKAKLEV